MGIKTFDLIAVVGPTASGKTRRAVEIANAFDGEIISGDSRQVYTGMDIGTGKDIEEYGDTPVHLIDIVNAGEKYNLHLFLKDFNRAYDLIEKREKLPVLCGGSGLYVETALSGIILPEVPVNEKLRKNLAGRSLSELEAILKTKKNLHNKTDVDTCQRAIRAIEIEVFYEENPEMASYSRKTAEKKRKALIIGIAIPREVRREKITRRLEKRLDEGMVDEVDRLLKQGIDPETLIYYGLEYKYLTLFLLGQIDFKTMKDKLEIAIHQFAKRQMTWFRGMEKRGYKINWIPYDLASSDFISRVKDLL